MKTYFICGRATTNFVPVNTRLARKTSSTPATFLLPALTTTDTSVRSFLDKSIKLDKSEDYFYTGLNYEDLKQNNESFEKSCLHFKADITQFFSLI
jgi:hypothetical protein